MEFDACVCVCVCVSIIFYICGGHLGQHVLYHFQNDYKLEVTCWYSTAVREGGDVVNGVNVFPWMCVAHVSSALSR